MAENLTAVHFDISINGANVFLNIEFIESFLLLIIG